MKTVSPAQDVWAVDEVHNYLALPQRFEDLLAEARGYRLSLCLAHQNLAQLPRQMAEGLSANARTKLIFNCSPEDARVLERHVTPEIGAHDLANLDRNQARLQHPHPRRRAPRCTLRTQPLPAGDERHGARLREQAGQRFGRDPATSNGACAPASSVFSPTLGPPTAHPTGASADPPTNPATNHHLSSPPPRNAPHGRVSTRLIGSPIKGDSEQHA